MTRATIHMCKQNGAWLRRREDPSSENVACFFSESDFSIFVIREQFPVHTTSEIFHPLCREFPSADGGIDLILLGDHGHLAVAEVKIGEGVNIDDLTEQVLDRGKRYAACSLGDLKDYCTPRPNHVVMQAAAQLDRWQCLWKKRDDCTFHSLLHAGSLIFSTIVHAKRCGHPSLVEGIPILHYHVAIAGSRKAATFRVCESLNRSTPEIMDKVVVNAHRAYSLRNRPSSRQKVDVAVVKSHYENLPESDATRLVYTRLASLDLVMLPGTGKSAARSLRFQIAGHEQRLVPFVLLNGPALVRVNGNGLGTYCSFVGATQEQVAMLLEDLARTFGSEAVRTPKSVLNLDFSKIEPSARQSTAQAICDRLEAFVITLAV